MESSLPVAERPRRPEWMKVRAPSADARYFDVKKLIHGASLHTICEEARCPNIAECWGRGTATFQILGDTCTRACRYCYVHSGTPERAARPARAAAARADRRADGPEARRRHLGRPRRRPRPRRAATTRRRSARSSASCPDATVEVLTPDFLGVEEEALATVLGARPEVFNHNIETVRRLHRSMRGAKASYDRALWLLAPREGARRLPGADEERDHRRPRRDERRGRRDDARPARARRRRRHDRPVPAAEREARADRPLGAPGRVPLVPRAGRGARLRLGLLRARSSARATAPTSSATRPRPAAAPSRTERRHSDGGYTRSKALCRPRRRLLRWRPLPAAFAAVPQRSASALTSSTARAARSRCALTVVTLSYEMQCGNPGTGARCTLTLPSQDVASRPGSAASSVLVERQAAPSSVAVARLDSS